MSLPLRHYWYHCHWCHLLMPRLSHTLFFHAAIFSIRWYFLAACWYALIIFDMPRWYFDAAMPPFRAFIFRLSRFIAFAAFHAIADYAMLLHYLRFLCFSCCRHFHFRHWCFLFFFLFADTYAITFHDAFRAISLLLIIIFATLRHYFIIFDVSFSTFLLFIISPCRHCFRHYAADYLRHALSLAFRHAFVYFHRWYFHYYAITLLFALDIHWCRRAIRRWLLNIICHWCHYAITLMSMLSWCHYWCWCCWCLMPFLSIRRHCLIAFFIIFLFHYFRWLFHCCWFSSFHSLFDVSSLLFFFADCWCFAFLSSCCCHAENISFCHYYFSSHAAFMPIIAFHYYYAIISPCLLMPRFLSYAADVYAEEYFRLLLLTISLCHVCRHDAVDAISDALMAILCRADYYLFRCFYAMLDFAVYAALLRHYRRHMPLRAILRLSTLFADTPLWRWCADMIIMLIFYISFMLLRDYYWLFSRHYYAIIDTFQRHIDAAIARLRYYTLLMPCLRCYFHFRCFAADAAADSHFDAIFAWCFAIITLSAMLCHCIFVDTRHYYCCF